MRAAGGEQTIEMGSYYGGAFVPGVRMRAIARQLPVTRPYAPRSPRLADARACRRALLQSGANLTTIFELSQASVVIVRSDMQVDGYASARELVITGSAAIAQAMTIGAPAARRAV
jgi:hypothetical protein